MPQLDVSTYTSQLFWLFVSFTLLYTFITYVTVPRMTKIFEARWQRIDGSMRRAEELKHQADGILKEVEAALEVAREQAHDHVMQMIQKVAITSSQRKKDITSMMMARVQSSEAHIERQKTQALDDIKNIAESIAVAAVEKLTEQKVDRGHVASVLNQLLDKKVA